MVAEHLLPSLDKYSGWLYLTGITGNLTVSNSQRSINLRQELPYDVNTVFNTDDSGLAS